MTRRTELAALFTLAWPIALTNLGNMALALVDVALIGRLGATSLAAAGLGNAVFFSLSLFGLGVLSGLDPVIAQALGARDERRADDAIRAGLLLALLVSIPILATIALIGVALPVLGVPPEIIEPTRLYLVARAPSLVPFLVLQALRSHLQAHGRTRPLVIGVVVANLVNVPMAYLLVFGVGSFAGSGLLGAGLAAGLASVVQLAVSGGATLRALARGSFRGLAPLISEIARIGLPLGFQVVAEAGSFAIVTFAMSPFGSLAIAAHQAALTAVNCTFQVALAFASATSVRVALALGDDRGGDARRAGAIGIACGIAVMGAGAVVFALAPRLILRAMTDDEAVVAMALPLFFVAACFQIGDGVQTVSQGALRGAGDTRFPFFLNLLGHYAIGLPLGMALAFGHTSIDAARGPIGLWWGLSAGLFAVAVSMTARFFLRVTNESRRTI